MHHYSQGRHTKQAHKGIPKGQFEEEQGLLGFFGRVSHLLKPKPSTRWVDINGPLRPHMFDLTKLCDSRKLIKLLFNEQIEISLLLISPKDLSNQISYRNADGDLLYFCHFGDGELLTEYGSLTYNKGMYIVIPKCLGHTFIPKNNSKFFVVENKNSHFNEPDRGMVGKNAVYDTEALVKPNLDKLHKILNLLDYDICKIVVKKMGEKTTFTYKENVYDTLGWKGDLYPYTLHVNDLMPLMSHRAHLPPSAHTTFLAKDFVVCTFLPRPLESDKDALKVPFYHQNIDYDEVLFYHDGDFFSRDNLHAGMMSLHPSGFPHGPHPKAVKNISAKTKTNEYAVMIDSRMPLKISNEASKVELNAYSKSWMLK